MPPRRFLLLAILAGFLSCTGRPLWAQTPPATPPAEAKPEAPKPTPAEELLAKAFDRLKDLKWMETDFKQQVFLMGGKWEAKGTYIIAPAENRIAYDVTVHVGGVPGTTKIRCDGQTLWHWQQIGKEKVVFSYPLEKLREASKNLDRNELEPDKVEQLIRDSEAEHGFLGIQPQLEELKQWMTFPKLESTSLNNKPVYLLQGEWSKAFLDKMAPRPEGEAGKQANLRELYEKRQYPFLNQPRSARVYLGRENLWPYRIEWLGPIKNGGSDELLTVLDFSEPVLAPKPGTEMSTLFSLPEAEKKLAKETDPAAALKARQQALAHQQKLAEEMSKQKPLDPSRISPSGK